MLGVAIKVFAYSKKMAQQYRLCLKKSIDKMAISVKRDREFWQ